jgi:GTPase
MHCWEKVNGGLETKGGNMDKPIVAIVGRPNVGKSQLFNRLLGSRIAIVQDEPGITRDRIYAECTWEGRRFLLVDTGGLDPRNEDPLKMLVQKQVEKALEEAALILFLVDAREGIHPLDREVAVQLKKTRKKVILLANKVDNPDRTEAAYEFLDLGFGEAMPLSALHGTNIGELLDMALEHLEETIADDGEARLRISLVGRRNVGKSSLINALTGQERSIVHEEAGTTRDSVDGFVTSAGRTFIVTDTSGLRRKGKIDEKVEYYSAVRTLRAIENSECVLLVLNAEEGIVAQDKKVAEQIQKSHKASIIIMNKWDLIRDNFPEETARNKKEEFRRLIKQDLYFIDYSPILFVSALRKTGVNKIMHKVEEIMMQYRRKVDNFLVNRIFQEAQHLRPAPSFKGRHLKIHFAGQEDVAPPTFSIKVNSPELIHFSYRRYLENTLRKALGFSGTPLVMNFRKK